VLKVRNPFLALPSYKKVANPLLLSVLDLKHHVYNYLKFYDTLRMHTDETVARDLFAFRGVFYYRQAFGWFDLSSAVNYPYWVVARCNLGSVCVKSI
jgi:hypothetical protein